MSREMALPANPPTIAPPTTAPALPWLAALPISPPAMAPVAPAHKASIAAPAINPDLFSIDVSCDVRSRPVSDQRSRFVGRILRNRDEPYMNRIGQDPAAFERHQRSESDVNIDGATP